MLGMAAISRAIRAAATCIFGSTSARATAARSDGASGSRSVMPAPIAVTFRAVSG